jgi:lipoprotein-anchoring transpeptidase ErfK/SrfK
MRGSSFLAAIAALCTMSGIARASEIVVYVNIQTQTMYVAVDDVDEYVWPVSTGRRAEWTPVGIYHPTSPPQRMHHSRKYHHAPMPFSIFFDVGRAVHGVPASEEPLLGTPASHGCVRIKTENAETLFDLVEANGIEHTTIIIE